DYRQVQQVDALLDRFSSDGHYHVPAKKVERNTGIERQRFGQQFTAQVEVQPRKPGEYNLRLSAKAPERPKDRGEEAAEGFGGIETARYKDAHLHPDDGPGTRRGNAGQSRGPDGAVLPHRLVAPGQDPGGDAAHDRGRPAASAAAARRLDGRNDDRSAGAGRR